VSTVQSSNENLRVAQLCLLPNYVKRNRGKVKMGKETGADTDIFKIPPVVWNFPQSRTLLGLAFVIANFRKHTDTHTHAHPSKWQRRRPVKYAINCRFHSWKFTGPTKKFTPARKSEENWERVGEIAGEHCRQFLALSIFEVSSAIKRVRNGEMLLDFELR